MNPGLISTRRLRVASWKPDRGRAPFAAAGLAMAVAAAGIATASYRTPEPVAPSLHTVAAVTYVADTKVPMPPSWLVAATTRVEGRFVFRPSDGVASPAAAGQAFDYFLATMQQSGWALSGKADPTRRGDWTLRWTFGDQSVLLTYFSRPAPKLTIDDCPPEPYC